MAEAADDVQLSDGTNMLSARACARIACLKESADCEIRVGGTVFPHLHKLVISMESEVLRSLVESGAPCSTITLHDNSPEEIALLISLIYDRNAKPLSADNVETVLQLCNKYNLPDVYDAAKHFLLHLELDTSNFTHWLGVAAQYRLRTVLERCQQYAATSDNLRDIMQLKGVEWLKLLSAAEQLRLVVPALQVAYKATAPPLRRTRYL